MIKYLRIVFFIVYLVLFTLFVYRLFSETNKLNQPSEIEIIEHNYDEPKDLFNDTTLSKEKRKYFEKLYNNR